ncbi:MAG: thioredoxin [Bacilli bacterium]
MIKHYNDDKFKEIKKETYVLVDFFATWCGPCKMLGSVLEKLDGKNVIPIVKVDVDASQNTAAEYKIFSVPTLILFKNGNEKDRVSGYRNLEELEKWVENNA